MKRIIFLIAILVSLLSCESEGQIPGVGGMQFSGVIETGGGGWPTDISSATYTGVYFSVASQNSTPIDISLNEEGTRMFMLGFTGDMVYQYSLSTGWDLSTISYDNVSFAVGSQDGGPADIYVIPDGTKMYMAGFYTDEIYQYSLSTAWDLSTASYDNIHYDFGTQAGDIRDFSFKPDGLKFYVLDYGDDLVYQYSLSTAWDLSTLSYDNVSFDFSTEFGYPFGLEFSADGSYMYITNNNVSNIGVHQYSLSTAWDLSTASYDNIMLIADDAFPSDVFFKSDGSVIFLVGLNQDVIIQYTF